MVDCQCRQCQRDSGTGHGSHLTFVGAPVEVTGEASYWETVGEGGNSQEPRLLPDLRQSPVYLTFPDMPEVFVATRRQPRRSGALPAANVTWTSAGHAWDHLDPAIPKFDKMPPPPAGR